MLKSQSNFQLTVRPEGLIQGSKRAYGRGIKEQWGSGAAGEPLYMRAESAVRSTWALKGLSGGGRLCAT